MARFDDLKKQVFNPEGEHLGEVEDVILDLTNQKIAFGILSFGGIFGLGETKYAIPWGMLDYEEDGEKFILDVDKEKLLEAESFDRTKYPYPYPYYGGLYGYWGYPHY